ARKPADDFNDVLRKFARGCQSLTQIEQLAFVWQMIVVQQENHLFKGDFTRQFIDVVAAINQLADIATYIAEPSGCCYDALQTFRNRRRRAGGHVKNTSLSRVGAI